MLRLLLVGPWKDKRLQAVAEELEQRASRLWRMDVLEVPESPKSLAAFLEARAAKNLLVSLDPMGEKMDSQAFARWVTSESRDLDLVVWGAMGPPENVKALLRRRLSLSDMTLSHELCRVFLMEQVYRSACILKGHPYPK
jgi:23S rRNA (pseudouridine1915-N3)-methyltransferase